MSEKKHVLRHVVKASWRRVVSVKPYETETLELGVEMETERVEDAFGLAEAAVDLQRALTAQGDALLAERLAAHAKPQTGSRVVEFGVQDTDAQDAVKSTAPFEPDPFLVDPSFLKS